MTRVSRRIQLVAFAGVALVFLVAFAFLRPPEGTLTDAQYIALAKNTSQGRLYFRNHIAPCNVTRVFTVQVNCDYVAAPGVRTEKFRVYFDPRRNNEVQDVEVQFDP
ncbi:MAG: hypothetical protein M3R54_04970 [Chloroflexota bacterium]|nr:hypothetical protein [Chloroflexota bacterium]